MSTQIDAALVPGSAAVVVGLLLLKVVNWVGCGRRENCVYLIVRHIEFINNQNQPNRGGMYTLAFWV